MTWYKEKAKNIDRQSLEKCFTSPSRQQKTAITITVLNMNSGEDKNNLKEALLEITGIDSVEALLPQKKLVIYFNPRQVRIESIAFAIAKLGYQYLKRC